MSHENNITDLDQYYRSGEKAKIRGKHLSVELKQKIAATSLAIVAALGGIAVVKAVVHAETHKDDLSPADQKDIYRMYSEGQLWLTKDGQSIVVQAKAGDTLWGVASELVGEAEDPRPLISELAKLNARKNDTLQPGDLLIVHEEQAPGAVNVLEKFESTPN